MPYHLSPDGNPRSCSATIACPYGGVEKHFEDKAVARKAYEVLMESLSLNGLKSEEELETLLSEHHEALAEEFGTDFADRTFSFLRYSHRTRPLILGRTRIIVLEPNHVLKVPVNGEGFRANSQEASASLSHEEGKQYAIPMAKTLLEEREEISYARAERVEIFTGSRRDLPDWTDWVDGGQVGYTKSGELVAYDL